MDTLLSGGAQRLLHTNLAHIDRDKFENEVANVFPGDYWREPIAKLGVPLTDLECAGHGDIPKGIRRLKEHLAQTRPDVIHTHLFAANIIGRIAGRSAGIPVISSVHNPEYEKEAAEAAGIAGRMKIRAAQLLDRLTAKRGCTRMIAVSKYVKDSTVKRLAFPASRIDVIYNPVNLPSESGSEPQHVRADLGFGEGAFLILNVGRVSPQKGLLHAVRAMPAILEANPNARLVSVGMLLDLDYLAVIRSEIAALGLDSSVVLLGERRDVNALLAASDLFLFPSMFEGLGIALAEAMTVGLACVASRIRPLDEFIDDGRNGVLTGPGSHTDIANEVRSLMEDEDRRSRIGAAAAETAGEMFRPEPAARKLEEVYLSVISERTRGRV